MSSAIIHYDFGQSRAAARHVSPLSTEMFTVQVEGIVREKHVPLKPNMRKKAEYLNIIFHTGYVLE